MKMLELEESHERLKQEMCRLKAVSTELGHSEKRNIGEGALVLRKSCAESLRKERRIQDTISLRDGIGGETKP